MRSIKDALNEKFNVKGHTISDAIEKMEGSSGGGFTFKTYEIIITASATAAAGKITSFNNIKFVDEDNNEFTYVYGDFIVPTSMMAFSDYCGTYSFYMQKGSGGDLSSKVQILSVKAFNLDSSDKSVSSNSTVAYIMVANPIEVQ